MASGVCATIAGTGEASVYELFSNAFTQTAETREYAQAMKLAPDGSFIIAKRRHSDVRPWQTQRVGLANFTGRKVSGSAGLGICARLILACIQRPA